MVDKSDIHQGGFYKLMREHDRRQKPFLRVDTFIPPQDVDLEALYRDPVPAPEKTPDDCQKYTAEAKWVELQAEFVGQSSLFLVHAMMIAISRRSSPPSSSTNLFQRIWTEKGETLANELPTRWLISAATTFADHGRNGDQRALGMGLTTLFDMIKLHDSERRISGQAGNKPFRRDPNVRRATMPFRMAPYSLRGGDLDRVMLARLWQLCERDPVIEPLGIRMLRMVMADRRTIFGRVQKYKDRLSP